MRDISKMPVGEPFTLTDDEVLEVKYITTLKTKVDPNKTVDKRGRAIESVDYAQMRYGTTSFTINTPEDVAIVSNAEQRADIYSMTLEISEFDEADIDDKGQPVLNPDGTPRMKKRKGLAFGSLMTYATKIQRETRKIAVQGAVHAEKVKYGLALTAEAAERAAKALEAVINQHEPAENAANVNVGG